jgi:hypothetical protein
MPQLTIAVDQHRSRAQRGCVFVDPHRAGARRHCHHAVVVASLSAPVVGMVAAAARMPRNATEVAAGAFLRRVAFRSRSRKLGHRRVPDGVDRRQSALFPLRKYRPYRRISLPSATTTIPSAKEAADYRRVLPTGKASRLAPLNLMLRPQANEGHQPPHVWRNGRISDGRPWAIRTPRPGTPATASSR